MPSRLDQPSNRNAMLCRDDAVLIKRLVERLLKRLGLTEQTRPIIFEVRQHITSGAPLLEETKNICFRSPVPDGECPDHATKNRYRGCPNRLDFAESARSCNRTSQLRDFPVLAWRNRCSGRRGLGRKACVGPLRALQQKRKELQQLPGS
jgi:hypothetical protein